MRMVLAHGNGGPGAWGARAILRTPLSSGGVGRNSCWLSIEIGSVPTQEPRSPRSSTEPSFLGPERSDAPAQATAIKPSGELIFAIESGTLDCENFELWMPCKASRIVEDSFAGVPDPVDTSNPESGRNFPDRRLNQASDGHLSEYATTQEPQVFLPGFTVLYWPARSSSCASAGIHGVNSRPLVRRGQRRHW
jgi:hypothetical protein